MQSKILRGLGTLVALGLVLATVVGCKKQSSPDGDPASGGKPAADATKVELVIAYGSEKKAWLEEQLASFNASDARLASGKQVHVAGRASGSGEAMADILAGTSRPHVFSPASTAYLTLLDHHWQSRDNHTRPLTGKAEPLVLSPIVIAMWRPMATALGWPGKDIGWADLVRQSQDPRGWGALGRPEWGAFKLGHTHPEFSNSGLLAVLAATYAATGKTTGLTTADLDAKATADFLAKVEDAVVHYGKSTSLFTEKMAERGPGYLSAAVTYENLVIEANGRTPAPQMPLVALYPVEGTFWSDHPYAILDADWVGADQREAAATLLAYLKARPAQARALALGFRPADPAIAIGAPVDAAHGVDPQQPQTLLAVPDGATLDHLVAVWRTVKKASDVTMVFDKSGSMVGQPLAQAKVGAKAFLATLDPRDRVTLTFFDDKVYPPIGPLELATGRATLEDRIDGAIASGGTALYDAVIASHGAMARGLKASPNRIHALVVMTDGVDENSKASFATALRTVKVEGERAVTVFTIGYGDAANADVLGQLAETARGTFSRGSVADITRVYRDIATFF